MDLILNHWADIAELVLAVLGVASIVARLTPTKVDDKLLAKVVGLVHLLGLTKKK